MRAYAKREFMQFCTKMGNSCQKKKEMLRRFTGMWVLEGNGTCRFLVPCGVQVLVGRSGKPAFYQEDAQILLLEDKSISRRHAMLIASSDVWLANQRNCA